MSKVKFGEGANTGMQTNVWGPAGWVFLHCIVQNYPWNPTLKQKTQYKKFLSAIACVLPCKYCRDSFAQYVSEKDSRLDDKSLKNRKTLTLWLYKIHNKVNRKLNVPQSHWPSFEAVWRRYESYRAKCAKTVENEKKRGCITPYSGRKKKCVIKIISANQTKASAFGIRPRFIKTAIKKTVKLPVTVIRKTVNTPRIMKIKHDIRVMDKIIKRSSKNIQTRVDSLRQTKRKLELIEHAIKHARPEPFAKLVETRGRMRRFIKNESTKIGKLKKIRTDVVIKKKAAQRRIKYIKNPSLRKKKTPTRKKKPVKRKSS